MKRALFNLLALMSVIVCAALLVAWQRSPWGIDADSQRHVNVRGDAWFLASWGGGLRVIRQRVDGVGGGATGLVASPDHLGCWDLRDEGSILVTSRFGPEEPAHGALGFGWGRNEYPRVVTSGPVARPVAGRPPPPPRRFAFTMEYVVLAAPYWALVPLAAIPAALWVRSWLRVRRYETTGRCPRCGYDLRAAPDSTNALLSRCPECGLAEGEEREVRV